MEYTADLIIIGAGLYGVQSARTWLEIHPEDNVVILEAGQTAGGVWSADRMYNAFWTQTPLRMAEFSDQPMHHVRAAERYYDFFPARHVTRYIKDYMRLHSYGGRPLSERIVYAATVESLVKSNNRWTVSIRGAKERYTAGKVIDASGLTSISKIPTIAGQETFKGLSIHHRQFARLGLLTKDGCTSVVVLGGGKSAADVAYAAANAGKKVSWIIRKSGSGPAAFVAAKSQSPMYRNSNESFYIRFTSTFLASIFAETDWWSRLIHRTYVGQQLLRRLWRHVHETTLKAANYDREDGRVNGFHNLKPDTELFWQNDRTGINQRANFFDIIATQVQVYRQDISKITEGGVWLADGDEIQADAIVYATGWRAIHPYLQMATAAELGLSVPSRTQNATEATEWRDLEQSADADILDHFPLLTNPPPYQKHERHVTPFRLYKGMLPVNDHSIVFVGKVMLGNHFRCAEAQALWAVAALDGQLDLPSEQEMREDIARTLAWCKRRYLSKGELGNWFYWDMVPYTDMLLKQLGLASHRKSLLKDLFEPCFAEDLKHLVEEYKIKHGQV